MATYVTPLPGHGPGPTGPKPPLRMVNRSPSLLRNGSCNLKSNAAKRKSAVELLQESKAFYVKSEQVLDSKQELKHSEHLQVTANPNFDVLLKTPVRVSHSWEGHGPPTRKTETVTRTAQTPLIQNSTTLLLQQQQLHEHHHHNHLHQQTPNSDHSLKVQQHTNFNHAIPEGVAVVSTCNQPVVPPRTLQPPAATEVPKGTSAPGLPPKSPRSLRPRSKTQPEPSCVAIANQCFQLGPHNHNQRPEYRRSHSERDTSDDFQIRLRRLLYTDSKENLDKVCPHPTVRNSKPPAAQAPCPVPCPTAAVATCIHKSMPDLSPLKLRQCCRRPQGSTSTTSTSSSASTREHLGPPLPPSPTPPLPQVTPSPAVAAAWTPALDQSSRNSVRRPILRSKSDISHRYSKSGPDLTQCGAATNRSSRSLADLERFFDKMGLDGGAFYQLHAGPSDSSPPVFFNSVSSLSSSCCKAGGTSEEESTAPTATAQCHVNAAREGLTNDNLSQHGPVETSIVERNARVIKWLYNCRKAS